MDIVNTVSSESNRQIKINFDAKLGHADKKLDCVVSDLS